MRLLRVSIIGCVVLGLNAGAAWAIGGSFPGMESIGDSLTDVGNAYLGTAGAYPPSPPYWQGRFSNGPVWVEYFAAVTPQIDLPPPAPSLAGGNDYAFGGSNTGSGLSLHDTPGMIDQASMCVGAHGGAASGSELFTIWGGANNLFDALESYNIPDPITAANDLAASGSDAVSVINTLYGAGAREFLVLNLPPLEKTPWGLSLPNDAPLYLRSLVANYSDAFNAQLATNLDALGEMPGIHVYRLDVHGTVEDIIAQPEDYGFTNVTEALIEHPEGTPEEYLFWDTVHPTTRAHELLGLRAADVVPEPSTMVLLATMALGSAVLALRRRTT